jgi:hypothetical protein
LLGPAPLPNHLHSLNLVTTMTSHPHAQLPVMAHFQVLTLVRSLAVTAHINQVMTQTMTLET